MNVRAVHKNDLRLVSLAKNIIRNNIYLTLATVDKIPWAAPIYYAADPAYNFYYISQLSSLHTKHILKNHRVAFAIFDSHQKEGTGNGIQGSGTAVLLKAQEIPHALKWYHTSFVPMQPKFFLGSHAYRFFKIVPDHFYVLDPDAKIDKRVEVKL